MAEKDSRLTRAWHRLFLARRGWLILAGVVLAAGVVAAASQVVPTGDRAPEARGAVPVEMTDDRGTSVGRNSGGDAPVTQDGSSPSTALDAPSDKRRPTQPSGKTVGDGELQLVGQDLEPGWYVAQVPSDSSGCYWERLIEVNARYPKVVAADNVAAGAQVVVEISETDEGFRSVSCGAWSAYAPPLEPSASFVDGTWIVGGDILVGTYKSSGPETGETCTWARQIGFSGSFYDVLESGSSTGPVTVSIDPDDISFKSAACGTWTLQAGQ